MVVEWRCILALLFLVSNVNLVCAEIVNRTIDDSARDRSLVYSPLTVGVWKNEQCRDCGINPNPAKALGGTFTSATHYMDKEWSFDMSITLRFTGVAIWVYFILFSREPVGQIMLTDLNMVMDDDMESAIRFTHDPTKQDNPLVEYHALVYTRTDLPSGDHTLKITPYDEGKQNNFLCFDYAIVSEDTTKTGSSNGLSPAAIGGIVTGGVAFLILLGLFLYLIRRRRRRKDSEGSTKPSVELKEISPSFQTLPGKQWPDATRSTGSPGTSGKGSVYGESRPTMGSSAQNFVSSPRLRRPEE